MANALPNELLESIKVLDSDLQDRIKETLEPIATELGPRELAVLDRLAQGIATGAPASELNAFVRLLPVSVSRVLQPAIEPVLAA
jgi:DNA-binding NarL/FixJ family response regulator